MMKVNHIYTAYVSWNNSGKRRPVLIYKDTKYTVVVFKITSKYKNKSAQIRKFYYPIKYWREAGLRLPSYIDTYTKEELSKRNISFKYVGKLKIEDMLGLASYVRNIKSL